MKFLVALLASALGLQVSQAVDAPVKPHIVFILADDLGIGDIRSYNAESMIETPHLDSLAAEGVSFTDTHTSGSRCLPSRHGIMTGQHLYFAMTAPHTPLAPEKRFVKEGEEHLYLGFVRQVDWSVGEVLKALDEAGLRENTLVIFSSDNGSPATAFDATNPGRDMKKLGKYISHSANGPWRGFKLENWEGGHRVPFILRWPGVAAAGSRSDVPFQLTDLFPTFASMINVQLPAEVAIDGRNVLSVWKGTSGKSDYANRIFVHPDHHTTGTAVRQGRWKLIPERKGEMGLYDLENDPGESDKLAAAHPEVVRELRKALESEEQRLTRNQ